MEAIKAGYTAGRDGDFMIALDPAVSELYDSKTKTYTLKWTTGESSQCPDGRHVGRLDATAIDHLHRRRNG